MRVAVTGANGFIASHVVSALVTDGHTVVACVRSDAPEKTKHLLAMDGDGEVLIHKGCDLSVAGSYDEAFSGCDVVMHTAAVVDISSNAETTISASIDGTSNIIDSARKSGAKRLVFTSSIIAVFSARGKADDHVFSETDWNTYSTPTLDPYGYGKTMAEKKVWECKEDMEVVTINPGVVLGPCFTKQHTKSSTALVREIIYGNKMHAFGATFVDVRDVAKAHAVAATSAEAAGKRFVVVNDAGPMLTTELATVAQPLFPKIKITGRPQFIYNPMVWWFLKTTGQVSEFQVANVEKRFHLSNASSKTVLGVQYRSLEQTLTDTIVSMTQTGGWIPTTPR